MKYNYLAFIFLLFFIRFSLSLYAKEGYDIKIKLNGFSGKNVLVAYHFGDKQYIADTLRKDENDSFTFQNDSIIRAGIYLLVLPPKNNYFEFLIDTDNQQFMLETESADMVEKMKITDSKVNQIFYEDIRFINIQRGKVDDLQKRIKKTKDTIVIEKLRAQLKEIDNLVKEEREKLITENPETLYAAILRASKEPEVPKNPNPKDTLFAYRYYKTHYWDEIDFNDERLLRTPILNNKIDYYLNKLVSPNEDSLENEVVALCLKTINNKLMHQYFVQTILNRHHLADRLYMRMVEEFYVKRTPYWADSAQAKKIIARWESTQSRCGLIAPELRLMDTQDNWVSMRSLEADYTILYFWDYENVDSKEVTPKLQKVAAHYLGKGANIKFYTVEINGTREKFKESIKEYGLDMAGVINTADPTRMTDFDKKYDVLSTPRIFLLDKNKKIIAKYISAAQLDELINHYVYKKEGTEVLIHEQEEKLKKHKNKRLFRK